MRIRKNVNFSSLVPEDFNKSIACQLNMSPWDAVDLTEETLNQFERKNSFTLGDGGFGNFNGDIGGSCTSLKEKKGKEKVVVNVEDTYLKNDSEGLKESICARTEGDNLQIIEKMAEPTCRLRRKGKGSTSTCNHDEFYYYSGFGPCWGKKRSAPKNRNFVIIDEPDDDEIVNEKGSKKRKKFVKARSLRSLI